MTMDQESVGTDVDAASLTRTALGRLAVYEGIGRKTAVDVSPMWSTASVLACPRTLLAGLADLPSGQLRAVRASIAANAERFDGRVRECVAEGDEALILALSATSWNYASCERHAYTMRAMSALVPKDGISDEIRRALRHDEVTMTPTDRRTWSFAAVVADCIGEMLRTRGDKAA